MNPLREVLLELGLRGSVRSVSDEHAVSDEHVSVSDSLPPKLLEPVTEGVVGVGTKADAAARLARLALRVSTIVCPGPPRSP